MGEGGLGGDGKSERFHLIWTTSARLKGAGKDYFSRRFGMTKNISWRDFVGYSQELLVRRLFTFKMKYIN